MRIFLTQTHDFTCSFLKKDTKFHKILEFFETLSFERVPVEISKILLISTGTLSKLKVSKNSRILWNLVSFFKNEHVKSCVWVKNMRIKITYRFQIQK